MPRAMSSADLTALQSSNLQPVVFVQITFNSTTIYLWSGIGSISWNGQTWTGLGSLLGMSPIEDGATVEARGMSITLSGLDATLISNCLSDFGLGLPATVYFGMRSSGSIISSPIDAWSGRVDRPDISVSGQEATITINLESRLLDMNNAVDRRLTNQDQQMTWPGDLGLQFVDALQERTLFWGQQATTTNNV
jgi:hypothetical protein